MTDVFHPHKFRSIGDLFQYQRDYIEALRNRRYKTMESITLPLDAIRGVEGPLDAKITNLVRVLNPLGVETLGSCEGHLDGRRYPFPWVSYRDPWGNVGPLIQQLIIDPFNLTSDVPWTASGGAVMPVYEAHTEDDLTILQKSANDFSNKLFGLFLKDRRAAHVRII